MLGRGCQGAWGEREALPRVSAQLGAVSPIPAGIWEPAPALGASGTFRGETSAASPGLPGGASCALDLPQPARAKPRIRTTPTHV